MDHSISGRDPALGNPVSKVLPCSKDPKIIELDDGIIYRKALYLMVKTMVSCRFSLKPIQ